jgi:hypothetical protein
MLTQTASATVESSTEASISEPTIVEPVFVSGIAQAKEGCSTWLCSSNNPTLARQKRVIKARIIMPISALMDGRAKVDAALGESNSASLARVPLATKIGLVLASSTYTAINAPSGWSESDVARTRPGRLAGIAGLTLRRPRSRNGVSSSIEASRTSLAGHACWRRADGWRKSDAHAEVANQDHRNN